MNKQLVVHDKPAETDEGFVGRMKWAVAELDLGWSPTRLTYMGLTDGTCVRYAHRFFNMLFTLTEVEREASIPKVNQKVIEIALKRLDNAWRPSSESTPELEFGHYDSPDDDAIRTLHSALEKLAKENAKRFDAAKAIKRTR